MKSIYIKISVFAMLIGALFSCSGPIVFKPSDIVPAATGTVKVKAINNGNFSVEVKVIHMAPVEKVNKKAQHYVVWVETKEGSFNIGKLIMDKDLNGYLFAQSTYKPRRVFITAEKDEKPVKADRKEVLITKKM